LPRKGLILPVYRLTAVFFKKNPEKRETALKWILNYATIKYTGIFLVLLSGKGFTFLWMLFILS